MSHRIQNNVGYKKIYPMSNDEDDGFCHYCGRKPSIVLSLEWDHVPALNVKIPPDCEEVRKTLIRSCKECNNLASDHPHMDFLERHFWLKAAYLRRYKRLLINEGADNIDRNHMSGYLLAAVNNADVKYEEILRGIGFGIREIEEIESPILQLRTKKTKRILEHIVIEYFHGIPSDDDEDDEPIDLGEVKHEEDEDAPSYDLEEFIDFLTDEAVVNNIINSHASYKDWLQKFPNRALSLELPSVPDKNIGVTWIRFNELVKEKLLYVEYEGEEDWESYPREVKHTMSLLDQILTPSKIEHETLLTEFQFIQLMKNSWISSEEEYLEFLEIIENDDLLVHFPKSPASEYIGWEFW